MTKTILVGINSRFNHTCLAVRSICEYVKQHLLDADISFVEYTINQSLLDILSDLSERILEKDECRILFSVYIWNIEITLKIIRELKKIFPKIIIACGGPEVSFRALDFLREEPDVDYVMCGEGEQTVLEILESDFEKRLDMPENKSDTPDGLCVRKQNEIIYTKERQVMCELDKLPFPYPDVETEKNKIFYYESSRGCPYSCAYCLSSVDKRVRFMSLERTLKDIQRFFDAKVSLVKFVDRTFNINEKRYLKIWEYIIENWNGITTMHFEIAAQTLSDKALFLLKRMKKNCIQFEIGVQSIHEKTLLAVGRKADTAIIADRVKKIPENIHVHLDLIAGLPYETLFEFKKSFDYTISLKPGMLQLGFLKILSGTAMEAFAKKFKDYRYLKSSPYEIIQTPWMSFSDLCFLKRIENLLDAFYNSGNFRHLMNYVIDTLCDFSDLKDVETVSGNGGVFDFFAAVLALEKDKDAHNVLYYFELMNNNINQLSTNMNFKLNSKIMYELLKLDFVMLKKCSAFPAWYKHNYNKDNHHKALLMHTDMQSTRLEYAHSEYEEFCIDLENLTLLPQGREQKVLILYRNDETKLIRLENDTQL